MGNQSTDQILKLVEIVTKNLVWKQFHINKLQFGFLSGKSLKEIFVFRFLILEKVFEQVFRDS